MFGFSNSRLNGPQRLSQQMQGLNQQLAAPATGAPAAQPTAATGQGQGAQVTLPQAFGQVRSQLQKLGIGGSSPDAPMSAAPYDPAAMTIPQVGQMPNVAGAYDPAGFSWGSAAADASKAVPTMAEAGGSILSSLASLFGV